MDDNDPSTNQNDASNRFDFYDQDVKSVFKSEKKRNEELEVSKIAFIK